MFVEMGCVAVENRILVDEADAGEVLALFVGVEVARGDVLLIIDEVIITADVVGR
jgi:hypothetical protein